MVPLQLEEPMGLTIKRREFPLTSGQDLSQDFKNACPKQHSQNCCLSRFSYPTFVCIRHTFFHIFTLTLGLHLKHKARDLGCFTSSPQAIRRSPNNNDNAAKIIPIDVCRCIYEL